MSESNIPKTEIIDHLLSKDSGQPPAPEMEKWLNESDANKSELAKFYRIWAGSKKLADAAAFNSAAAFRKVDDKIQQQFSKRNNLYRISIAVSSVAAVLLIVFGIKLFLMSSGSQNGLVSVRTEMGDRSFVVLPDGTKVKLNGGSSLNYSLNAKNHLRTVSFSGEAFFEVAKSKTPFEISTTSGLKVKVLGTKFNLKAYPTDGEVQTTLIEGSVALSSIHSSQSLKISPGQIASYDKASDNLSLSKGVPEHILSWMDNKLYMDNMDLGEVCRRLERWYNVTIWIKDESLRQSIHYTGVLSEETIVDVLDALCQLSPIQYEMTGKKVVITKK